MKIKFSFIHNSNQHKACIIGKNTDVLPEFIFIHGAGTGTKERIHTFSDVLEDNGVTMLAFDQSGAGNDIQNLKQSSLEKRVTETIHAITEFASKEPLVVCGSSMGGEVALRMLEQFPVKTLILFLPSNIYPRRIFSKIWRGLH